MKRFRIERFDGVFGGWYAVRDLPTHKESGVHITRFGAWVAGWLL